VALVSREVGRGGGEQSVLGDVVVVEGSENIGVDGSGHSGAEEGEEAEGEDEKLHLDLDRFVAIPSLVQVAWCSVERIPESR
jgi:hypothetical protein